MRSAKAALMRVRAFQCVIVATMAVFVHCADPAVGPRISRVGAPLLNISSASMWTASILALPKGATASRAYDVNDGGVVVGEALVNGDVRAVRWINGVPSYLPNPAAGESRAFAINNSGVAVGSWDIHPVKWNDKGLINLLPKLQPCCADHASDINDEGIIVGRSSGHAVQWTAQGAIHDLHPGRPYFYSLTESINESRDIVGAARRIDDQAQFGAATRAYLWRSTGSQQELGAPPGAIESRAMSVNGAVTVVGGADGPGLSVGFVWTDALGMQNAGLGPGHTWAKGISELGRIVGEGEFQGSVTTLTIAVTRYAGVLDTLPNPYRRFATANDVNLCGDIAGWIQDGTTTGYRAVLWTKRTCDR